MKIGLVVEGGGMKCAYGAAVLDKFLDDRICFDYCIGVSAGAANTLSYLAGQRGRNKRFYTDHISDPMYFGVKPFLKNGNLFNLQYIYGDMTNSDGKDPLDYEAVMANPAEYELVTTCAETGQPVYFKKEDIIKDDYRHVMSSCAIPVACKPIEIDGIHYYDGGLTDAIPVRHALDQGCDKLVVISSKPRDYVKEPQKFKMLYSSVCRKYPETVKSIAKRHKMYQRCQKWMFELEKRGKCFIFGPSEHLKMSTYGMDREANEKLYQLGLSDYDRRRSEFMEFLEG